MAVTFKNKFIALFILHLINDARSGFSIGGSPLPVINPSNIKVSNAQGRTALHWPKGIVTYYLDNDTYDYYIAQRVRMAMNVLESASCVKFKPTLTKPAENITWINFTNPQGERDCVHETKQKIDGEIILVLGYECMKEHEILHSLLHAIGFKDEVSHPQRDQYIRVMWNNIQPEYRHLYHISPSDEETSQLVTEYDPLSIMHFHDRAFSINGHATIMPLVPGLAISPSDDLSQLDKMRLRLLFDHECNKRKVGDMIDTCTMLLSKDAKPKDPNNISESKTEEEVDETAEVDGEDKEEKVNKHKNLDKIEDVDETNAEDETDKGHETDKASNETSKNNNVDDAVGVHSSKLKSIENEYDLNEYHPDNMLNGEIPNKLLDQDDKTKEAIESRSAQVGEAQ